MGTRECKEGLEFHGKACIQILGIHYVPDDTPLLIATPGYRTFFEGKPREEVFDMGAFALKKNTGVMIPELEFCVLIELDPEHTKPRAGTLTFDDVLTLDLATLTWTSTLTIESKPTFLEGKRTPGQANISFSTLRLYHIWTQSSPELKTLGIKTINLYPACSTGEIQFCTYRGPMDFPIDERYSHSIELESGVYRMVPKITSGSVVYCSIYGDNTVTVVTPATIVCPETSDDYVPNWRPGETYKLFRKWDADPIMLHAPNLDFSVRVDLKTGCPRTGRLVFNGRLELNLATLVWSSTVSTITPFKDEFDTYPTVPWFVREKQWNEFSLKPSRQLTVLRELGIHEVTVTSHKRDFTLEIILYR